MKTKILFIIYFSWSYIIFGQVKSIVIDSITKKPIHYTNIWIKNKDIGTTSNEKGEFKILKKIDNTDTILFSAIGYKTKQIKSNQIEKWVILSPNATQLPEVIIFSNKKKKIIQIDKFNKSKINFYLSCGKKPWIIAKFFPYKKDYNETQYLNSISILAKSNIKNSKFNIRLYSVNKHGEPENYIYNKNIIGVAKKGKNITNIDIRDLNIKFPKKGFFIAIEWLIVNKNKHTFNYTMKGSKNKFKSIIYEPKIGTIPSDTNKNSWIFNQGKWEKIWKNKGPLKKYKDKYNLIAIELNLSN